MQKQLKGYTNIPFEWHDMKAMMLNSICNLKENKNPLAHRIPDNITDSQAAPLLCAGAIGYRSLRLTGLSDGQSLGLTGFGASAHLVLKMCRHVRGFLQLASEIPILPEVGVFELQAANQALMELKERKIRGAKVLGIS